MFWFGKKTPRKCGSYIECTIDWANIKMLDFDVYELTVHRLSDCLVVGMYIKTVDPCAKSISPDDFTTTLYCFKLYQAYTAPIRIWSAVKNEVITYDKPSDMELHLYALFETLQPYPAVYTGQFSLSAALLKRGLLGDDWTLTLKDDSTILKLHDITVATNNTNGSTKTVQRMTLEQKQAILLQWAQLVSPNSIPDWDALLRMMYQDEALLNVIDVLINLL